MCKKWPFAFKKLCVFVRRPIDEAEEATSGFVFRFSAEPQLSSRSERSLWAIDLEEALARRTIDFLEQNKTGVG